MDLTKYTIQRTVYTSFDLLSDIGGLRDILILFGGAIFSVVQGNGFLVMILGSQWTFDHSSPPDKSIKNPLNQKLKRISER